MIKNDMGTETRQWKETSAHRKLMWIFFAAFFAFGTEMILSFLGAWHGYDRKDKSFCLPPVQVVGFEQAGDFFMKTEEVAFLDFTVQRQLGYLELSFTQPLTHEIEVDLYETNEPGQEFSRFRKKNYFFMPGTTKAKISLSGKRYETIRLNFYEDIPFGEMRAGEPAAADEILMDQILAQSKGSRFLLFFVLYTSVIWALLEKRKKDKIRIEKKTHMVYLDAIRTLAAFLTISLHVIEPTALMQVPGTARSLFFNIALILCFTCNILFFFISGALLLPAHRESAFGFYVKRGKKIVIPFLIYAFFYLRLMCASSIGFLPWLRQATKDILGNSIKMGPHLWLIYELMGVYLLVPFLRCMLKNMSEKMEKWMIGCILAAFFIRTYRVYLGDFAAGFGFLDSWSGIFLMGYFLNQSYIRKFDGWILAGGILSLLVSAALSVYNPDYKQIVCNQSILMIGMAASIFVLFIRGQRHLTKLAPVFAFLGKYSYSMLLIHWFVYRNIISNGWIPEQWSNKSIGQIFLPIFLIMSISLLISIVIDQTVVFAVETGVEKILERKTKKKQMETSE